MSGYWAKYQQWCLVSHRYAKLQQSHTDDVTGAVRVADRQCLGLEGKKEFYTSAKFMAGSNVGY